MERFISRYHTIKEDVLMTGVHTDNAVESQSCQGTSSTAIVLHLLKNTMVLKFNFRILNQGKTKGKLR